MKFFNSRVRESNWICLFLMTSLQFVTATSFAHFDENHFEKHPEQYFLIAPSSIPGNSGLGVYVQAKLPRGVKVIPKGTVLPFPYPGRLARVKEFTGPFIKELVGITEKYDVEKNLNRPVSAPEIQDLLKNLREKRSIEFIPSDYSKSPDEMSINWDHFYDSFIAYTMEGLGADGERYITYWTKFSYEGEPVIDSKDMNNLPLFVNEPPPFDFINLITLKKQKSRVSLLAQDSQRKHRINSVVDYVTMTDVYPGEELFLSYGPIYQGNRHGKYEINLSQENGGGIYELVKLFVNLSKKKYLKNKELTSHLSIAKHNHLYKSVQEFFEKVENYRHDETVRVKQLNHETMNWFKMKFGSDYEKKYQKKYQKNNLETKDSIRMLPQPHEEPAIALPSIISDPEPTLKRSRPNKDKFDEEVLQYWMDYVLGNV